MTTIKRPMLAASATEEDIKDALRRKGALLVSPKIDGIRCLALAPDPAEIRTRSMKPLPNQDVARAMDCGWTKPLDGELVVGDPTSPTCFLDTTAVLRRVNGGVPTGLTYWVFDMLEEHALSGPDVWGYSRRLFDDELGIAFPPVEDQFGGPPMSRPYLDKEWAGIKYSVVPTWEARTWDDVLAIEHLVVRQSGFEGLILRDPMAPYKQGRSTVREAGMLKLKRFVDAEAEVIGAEELLHNENPATISELWLTKRSSHKANKVGGGMLGALVVRHLETGVEFKIGTGFDEKARAGLWAAHQRGELAGKVAKFKSFPVGVKEAPRHPSFLGFREPWDMDR